MNEIATLEIDCPVCGETIEVGVRSEVGAGTMGEHVSVSLRADTLHLCPGPGGGERLSA